MKRFLGRLSYYSSFASAFSSVSIFFLSLMILSPLLVAETWADWASGGGTLSNERENPWFLQNTKNVTYCIEMDETHFGVSLDLAREKIQSAIAYWKNQFKYADTTIYASGPKGDQDISGEVSVISSHFTEVPCSSQEGVDLRFQLGLLNEEQKKYLEEPQEVVGIAVRTHYDKKLLKGKGFIYISPETGPLALDREGLLNKRWQIREGFLLECILVHELGHVFGFGHDGNSLMMNSRFSEGAILNAGNYSFYMTTKNVPDHFLLEKKNFDYYFHTSSSYPHYLMDIFELPSLPWKIEGHWHAEDGELELLAFMEDEPAPLIIGRIKFSKIYAHDTGYAQPISLYLPKEQQVFPEFAGQSGWTIDITTLGKKKGRVEFLGRQSNKGKQLIIEMDVNEIYLTGFDSEGQLAFHFLNLGRSYHSCYPCASSSTTVPSPTEAGPLWEILKGARN